MRRRAELGVRFRLEPLTRENYARMLDADAGRPAISWSTSRSRCRASLWWSCAGRRARSISTPASSPGPAATPIPSLTPSLRSNYALREKALALRKGAPDAPTAVLTHGANPGLVSHLVKEALLDVARDTGVETRRAGEPRGLGRARRAARHQGHPHRRARHAGLAHSQAARRVRQHLVDRRLRRRGLPAGRARLGQPRAALSAGWRPPRLRLRRRDLPAAARRLDPGAQLDAARRPLSTASSSPTARRSRSPTTSRVRDGDAVRYRPTVHYAYHPCDDAVLSMHELAGKNWEHADAQAPDRSTRSTPASTSWACC